MFKILDGREAFYQWDTNRQVVVDDRSITQVHYCNRTDDCALICECYELDSLWVADVPNVLLQDNWRIRVYAFDGNATKHEARYDVIARSKPDTYVYTETEVLSYETISKRMDAIEEDIEGVAEEVITDYLKENPIDVDLTGYATEEFVNEKMAQVVVEEKEVYIGTSTPTDPATKIWVNPNAENPFATKTYVDEKVAEAGGGSDVDLSNYYTKSQVDTKIKNIELTPGPTGATGPAGKDGKDGKDGYTPIKGVDYFDGTPGKDGKDGANGKDGQDGYTPVKGVDYFDGAPGADGKDYVLTEADKQEIADMVDVSGGEGGSVAIDGITIIENEDGTISAAIGGGKVIDQPATITYSYEDATGIMFNNARACRSSVSPNPFAKFDSRFNYPVTLAIRNKNTGIEETWTGEITYYDKDYWNFVGTVEERTVNGFILSNINYQYGSNLNVDGDSYELDTIAYLTKLVLTTLPTYKYNKIDSNYLNLGVGFSIDGDGVLSNSVASAFEFYNGGLVVNSGNGNYVNSPGNKTNIYAGAIFGENNKINVAGYGPAILLGYQNQLNCSSGGWNNALIGSDNMVTGYVYNSVAIGQANTIEDYYGVACGNGLTVGSPNQTVYGNYNMPDWSEEYTTIIGNGSMNGQINGLTMNSSGDIATQGTISNGGADYAEYFEWLDGNPEAEDRVGLLVTLDGNKIRYARAIDDVLGVVSGTATVLGDDAEWNWQGRFLRDNFGRVIMEEVEIVNEVEVKNDEGEIETHTSKTIRKVPKENPAYDKNKKYVSRAKRAEWDAIGMMGKLYVKDDGTCVVNGYAMPGENGVATLATGKTNMRVMERISDNVVRVLLK